MKTIVRKKVDKHLVRNTFWGPIYFIKITFADDRVVYGVSSPDGSHTFPYPGGREEAWKRAHAYKVYALGSVPC